IITHYAKLLTKNWREFDIFLIKKALFSRLVEISILAQVSKTRINTSSIIPQGIWVHKISRLKIPLL
ncbi:hypothetical protein, partial [Pelotomaculum sp. FP]|uniref:hypothetical protein n=1 Tax=Pelotomaculum sp. FP TaxID=261474 RepID=UPI00195F7D18